MTLREPTLGDRMAADRARLFVGRSAELGALEELLAPDAPHALAWIFGPGGIGKTEIVRAFQRRCEAVGRPVGWIDGGTTAPNPVGFREAFDAARATADIIVVDGAEHLASIVPWLCAAFLPELPASTRLIMAGRDRPPAALTTDPAWVRLVRIVPIGNFTTQETRDYLRARDVPQERHAEIARATFGHPLALALAAEVAARSAAAPRHLAEDPDVGRGLLAQLLREVPSPRHERALWALAVVRHLTGPLLRALVDERAEDLYNWLHERTFVTAERGGLVPHDLVRELLLADLGRRDPVLEKKLAARAVDVLVDSFDTAGADASHVLDEIYYAAGGRSAILAEGNRVEYAAEPLRREEWPAVEAMSARHEGATTASVVRFWLERGGEAYGIRDLDDRLTGFMLFLWLDAMAPADVAKDPALGGVYRRLDARGGVGRPTLCARTWMDARTYKAFGPTQVAANKLSGVVVWRRRPEVLVGVEGPIDVYMQVVPPGMYERWPEMDCVVEGVRHGVVAVDFRSDPLVPWFKRYMRTMMQVPPDAPSLAREAFDPAVRDALRRWHQPDALVGSPLLDSRLVRASRPATPLDAVRALRELLHEQSEMFLASEKDAVHHRVLAATYFEPHAKQLQAAGALGMPYGTYRRYHATALRRLTEALWQREMS